jgi:hypothetical protein
MQVADWSLDNQISTRIFKVENNLAPFHKSVSCWALVGMWVVDLASAIHLYSRWQATGRMFEFCLLLATATACLGLLLYYRIRLTRSMSTASEATVGAADIVRDMSSGMVRLTGVILMVVLFVLSST